MLGGSVSIYAAMAACSAASGPHWTSGRDGGSSGGSSGAATGDGAGAIIDALTDPVGEAQAAPQTTTVNCNQQFMVGSVPEWYAEQAYPGMTTTQLASLVAILHDGSGSAFLIPGYTDEQIGARLRDGYAAVVCSNSSQSVTFVLP
jgi:hypothetical protein